MPQWQHQGSRALRAQLSLASRLFVVLLASLDDAREGSVVQVSFGINGRALQHLVELLLRQSFIWLALAAERLAQGFRVNVAAIRHVIQFKRIQDVLLVVSAVQAIAE